MPDVAAGLRPHPHSALRPWREQASNQLTRPDGAVFDARARVADARVLPAAGASCRPDTPPVGADTMASHAHIAHGVAVSLHAVCCGAPIALSALAALSGAGVLAGVAGAAVHLHQVMHGYEIALLSLSAVFVVIGAVLEHRRRARGVRQTPWLFLASCAALLANTAVVASHQQAHAPSVAAISAPAAVSAHDHAH